MFTNYKIKLEKRSDAAIRYVYEHVENDHDWFKDIQQSTPESRKYLADYLFRQAWGRDYRRDFRRADIVQAVEKIHQDLQDFD